MGKKVERLDGKKGSLNLSIKYIVLNCAIGFYVQYFFISIRCVGERVACFKLVKTFEYLIFSMFAVVFLRTAFG